MVDWTKKVRKSVGVDLGGEDLNFAMIVSPTGNMSRMVGGQVAGVVGAVIGVRGRKQREKELDGPGEGVAGTIPSAKNLIVGLTSTRMLVWSQGAMSGKPKDLVATIPAGDLARLDLEKGKLATQAVMRFSDDSAWAFEIPRLSNTDGFQEAFGAMAG